MNNVCKPGAGIAAVVFALWAPIAAHASTSTSPVLACDGHGDLSITIGWNANPPQGQGHITISPDPNTTCVHPGDNISFSLDSSVPSPGNWSASFPAPIANGIFVSNCAFGNGSNQSSSCQVKSNAPSFTYHYSATVNGETLDPKVIIQ